MGDCDLTRKSTYPRKATIPPPLRGTSLYTREALRVVRRGRRCGVAQRSMPQWGIELHEWARSVRVDANLRVGRRGGFYIRPQCTRTCRGVADAAPYAQPHAGCRGEQCSPEGFSGGAKFPGRMLYPPLRFSGKVAPCKAPPGNKSITILPHYCNSPAYSIIIAAVRRFKELWR